MMLLNDSSISSASIRTKCSRIIHVCAQCTCVDHIAWRKIHRKHGLGNTEEAQLELRCYHAPSDKQDALCVVVKYRIPNAQTEPRTQPHHTREKHEW